MYEIHEKVWGYEEWIVNDVYCGKILNLKKGYKCSDHFHKIKDETFLVIEGKVLLHVQHANPDREYVAYEKMVLTPYDSYRIHPGAIHSFTGFEDSKIIEFSTKHMEDDSYRLNKSEKIPVERFNKLLKLLERK
jgi:D-lyxose ketol-isomerase